MREEKEKGGKKKNHNETNMPQKLSKKLQLKQHEQEINNTALHYNSKYKRNMHQALLILKMITGYIGVRENSSVQIVNILCGPTMSRGGSITHFAERTVHSKECSHGEHRMTTATAVAIPKS